VSLLVSCDPGIRVAGLAVFRDGALAHAELLRNPAKKARGPEAWWAMAGVARSRVEALMLARTELSSEVHEFVVEVPQIYRFGKVRVDPDDLIQLAGVGGAVGSVLRPRAATGYYPRQWKGSVDKQVMVERILSRLSLAEKKALAPCPPSLAHNQVDAVGLGLYHLGRL
jgi:hypothetical protein